MESLDLECLMIGDTRRGETILPFIKGDVFENALGVRNGPSLSESFFLMERGSICLLLDR